MKRAGMYAVVCLMLVLPSMRLAWAQMSEADCTLYIAGVEQGTAKLDRQKLQICSQRADPLFRADAIKILNSADARSLVAPTQQTPTVAASEQAAQTTATGFIPLPQPQDQRETVERKARPDFIPDEPRTPLRKREECRQLRST